VVAFRAASSVAIKTERASFVFMPDNLRRYW
jgi:hypothetical protein